jgi:predicted secreted protein
MHKAARIVPFIAVALAAPAVAPGSATPVGPLPNGPVKALSVRARTTFVVSLPKPAVPGRVWRLARPYEPTVVSGLREGETPGTVWLRFRAVAHGKTSLIFALTRGERSHAYAARTFTVTVR